MSSRVSTPDRGALALAGTPPLTPEEFKKISGIALDHFGLDLRSGKESMVAARLAAKIRQGGFPNFSEYCRHVMQDSSGEAMIELIDSLVTNYTCFLREPAHFEFMREAALGEFRELPALRVWSAACSSGEEPYSIAMTLLDCANSSCRWERSARILATDISTRSLDRARERVYEEDRLRGVSRNWRQRFLLQGNGRHEGRFKVKPETAAAVTFERLNLIGPLPRRTFEFVFCRNVMIYFSRATQQQLISRLAGCIGPGGYLFTGHSESLGSICHPFEYIQPAVYRLPRGSKTR